MKLASAERAYGEELQLRGPSTILLVSAGTASSSSGNLSQNPLKVWRVKRLLGSGNVQEVYERDKRCRIVTLPVAQKIGGIP